MPSNPAGVPEHRGAVLVGVLVELCSLSTIPAGFRASHPEEEFIKFAHQWTIKKDGYSFPKIHA
jgi:hypothetical protein